MKRNLILGFISLLIACELLIAAYTRSEIDSLNTLTSDYIFSNITHSISVYKKAIDAAKQLNYRQGEALAQKNLGMALYLKGDYDASVKAYITAIRLMEEVGMREQLAAAYGDMGYQMKRRDLERAKKYMRYGIRIAQANSFKNTLCALYDNYGVLQEMSSQLDSALYYYKQSLQLKTALNDSTGIPFSLNNIAGIFAVQGNFEKSAEFLRRSDRIRQKEKGHYGRLVNMVTWGDWFFKQNLLDSAIIRYRNALKMPGALEQPYLSSYCLNQLRNVYEQRGNYKEAYGYLKEYMVLNDSLLNQKTSERIANLETEFETEKKDRQLAEYKLKAVEHNRQMVLLGAFVFILLIGSAGIYVFHRLKRKQMQRDLEMTARLKQSEYEQAMAEEKLRISRELHDNIGSQLTFIISSLDNARFGMQEQLQDRLKKLSDFGKDTLSELRNTVWAMKQDNTDPEQLLTRLNDIKRRFNESLPHLSLQFESEIDNSLVLNSALALNILRIVQEAVQNAVKHAQAKRILVRLKEVDHELHLTVSDDGQGFDLNNSALGAGLTHMRQRCENASGAFEIESDERGTVVRCRIPVE